MAPPASLGLDLLSCCSCLCIRHAFLSPSDRLKEEASPAQSQPHRHLLLNQEPQPQAMETHRNRILHPWLYADALFLQNLFRFCLQEGVYWDVQTVQREKAGPHEGAWTLRWVPWAGSAQGGLSWSFLGSTCVQESGIKCQVTKLCSLFFWWMELWHTGQRGGKRNSEKMMRLWCGYWLETLVRMPRHILPEKSIKPFNVMLPTCAVVIMCISFPLTYRAMQLVLGFSCCMDLFLSLRKFFLQRGKGDSETDRQHVLAQRSARNTQWRGCEIFGWRKDCWLFYLWALKGAPWRWWYVTQTNTGIKVSINWFFLCRQRWFSKS